jgi:hypothetical protein
VITRPVEEEGEGSVTALREANGQRIPQVGDVTQSPVMAVESLAGRTFEIRNDDLAALRALGRDAPTPPKLRVVARRGNYGSVIAESETYPQNLVVGWLREGGRVSVADKSWRTMVCQRCGESLEHEVWRLPDGVNVCADCASRRYYRWWSRGGCRVCERKIHIGFASSPRDVRYCQGECAEGAARERQRVVRGEIACDECGESFTPTRSDSRYCSPACRQKAYRKRKSEAPA